MPCDACGCDSYFVVDRFVCPNCAARAGQQGPKKLTAKQMVAFVEELNRARTAEVQRHGTTLIVLLMVAASYSIARPLPGVLALALALFLAVRFHRQTRRDADRVKQTLD